MQVQLFGVRKGPPHTVHLGYPVWLTPASGTAVYRMALGPDGADVKTRTATIVLRDATQNHLDNLECTLDDGVASLKPLLKDSHLVPNAGATELALARRVDTYGAGLRRLSQHAVRRFAYALEVTPRTLAEDAHGEAEGNEIVAR